MFEHNRDNGAKRLLVNSKLENLQKADPDKRGTVAVTSALATVSERVVWPFEREAAGWWNLYHQPAKSSVLGLFGFFKLGIDGALDDECAYRLSLLFVDVLGERDHPLILELTAQHHVVKSVVIEEFAVA